MIRELICCPAVGNSRTRPIPARYHRDQALSPIRVLVSRHSESWRTRCNDQRRVGCRVFLALRQSSLFPAMETHPRFANFGYPVHRRTRTRRAPKRTAVDLGSGIRICGGGAGIEANETSRCACNE